MCLIDDMLMSSLTACLGREGRRRLDLVGQIDPLEKGAVVYTVDVVLAGSSVF